MDDIGLGNAIANLIYGVLAMIGIVGLGLLLRKRFFSGAVLWTSFVINLLLYLYLMGNYRFYPSILYPVINEYWPILNFLWAIYLIRNHLLIKNAKTKNK